MFHFDGARGCPGSRGRWWRAGLLLAAAQARAADTPPASAAPASATSTTAVLQGFHVRWDARPHRLHSLGMQVDLAAAPGGGTEGTLAAQVRGGSWASGVKAHDTPAIEVDYAALTSRHRPAYQGTANLQLAGNIAPEREKRVPAAGGIRIDDPLPQGATGAAVFLTGFQIDTDAAHPDGFTVHELGISVGPPTVAHGRVAFDVTARLVAAAVLDRRQNLEDYGASVDIYYVVVPSAAEAVHRLSVTGTMTRGISLVNDNEAVRPGRFPFAVDTHAPAALVGLSGFLLQLDEQGSTSGRYLREVGVQLDDVRLDPVRGRVDGDAEMVFSNSGDVARPIAVTLSADLTVLDLTAGETTWSGRWADVLPIPEVSVHYPEGLSGPAEPPP